MIDRIFIAVLLLSVSGFVFCAFFLPLEKLAYRFTSAKTMVFVNTAALFSFLLPFYLIVSFYDGSEKLFQDYMILVFQEDGPFEAFVIAFRGLPVTKYLCGLWLFGAVWLLVYRTGEYLSFTAGTTASGFLINGSIWAEVFCGLKREQNVRNVRLIGSCCISAPCTFGIRNRYIAIPAVMLNSFAEDEVKQILRHEFYHVIHRDLLRKFLIMQVGCIHWFNPLFYYLKENLSDWQETVCDDEVTKDMGEEERKRYIRLVMKVLELQKDTGGGRNWGTSMIGSDRKSCQRRFERLLRKSTGTNPGGRVLVTALVLFSLFLGNAAAKEADIVVNQLFSPNVQIASRENLKIEEVREIETRQLRYSSGAGADGPVEFRPYNAADAAYEIFWRDGFAAFPQRADPFGAEHPHQYMEITLREHRKYPDGSCEFVYYDSEECSVCGTIRRGRKFCEEFQAECSHKSENQTKRIYQQVINNGTNGANDAEGAVIHNKEHAVRQRLDY